MFNNNESFETFFFKFYDICPYNVSSSVISSNQKPFTMTSKILNIRSIPILMIHWTSTIFVYTSQYTNLYPLVSPKETMNVIQYQFVIELVSTSRQLVCTIQTGIWNHDYKCHRIKILRHVKKQYGPQPCKRILIKDACHVCTHNALTKLKSSQ